MSTACLALTVASQHHTVGQHGAAGVTVHGNRGTEQCRCPASKDMS